MRLAPIPLYLPAWQVHLLSGPPGGGKTTLIASWARALTEGAPIFGKPTNPMPWIGTLIADREQADTLQWYKAVGLPHIAHHSVLDDFSIKTSRLRKPLEAHKLLTELIESFAIPQNGLLILDPVAPWCGGDLNKYHLVMPAMIDLGRLCLEHQITILGLAHTGKQRGDPRETYIRPQDRILGSTALLGCSGTQMALVPPMDDSSTTYEFTWVPHHAKAETFQLERDDDTGLFIPAGHQLDVPRRDLLACIPDDEPIVVKDLLAKIIHDQKQVISRAWLFKLLAQWIRLGLVKMLGKGRYQRIKPS